MPAWSEELGGAAQASQGVAFAQASAVALVASNNRRLAVTIVAGAGPVYLGYGPTAVPSQSLPLPSGAMLEERDYKGQITHVVGAAAPATAPVFFSDVILP